MDCGSNFSFDYLNKVLLNSFKLLIILLLCAINSLAQSSINILEINNLQKTKVSKKYIYFKFDLNNIGDSDIDLPYQTSAHSIDFRFEETNSNFQSYQSLITAKISKMSIILAAGAVKTDIKLKLPIQKKELYKNFFSNTDTIPTKLKDSNYLKCADLIIDSIKLINRKGKNIKVEIEVQNIGNQEIKLWGKESSVEDNIAIKTFLSSHNRLLNSSLFLRGLYIHDEANNIGGILLPNQKLGLIMELNIKDKTKFTPYLIFEVNSLRSELECTFDNNLQFMRLD